jgi:hypothetical protein
MNGEVPVIDWILNKEMSSPSSDAPLDSGHGPADPDAPPVWSVETVEAYLREYTPVQIFQRAFEAQAMLWSER